MDILKSLGVLLGYFCFTPRCEITVGEKTMCIHRGNKYRVRVRYLVDGNALEVCDLDLWGNKKGGVSVFELENERAFGGAIRSICRRVGVNVPSFEEIDRVLTEGPGEGDFCFG